MTSHGDNPRLILGMKVRRLRRGAGQTLNDLSAASGLSVSYLSEIETGSKYPKPEKMVALADALEVPFDQLVSLEVEEELSPLKEALSSPLLREFPFELFGVTKGDLLTLVKADPARAGALFHALLEVGQSFDVDIESFLLAALRAYQQMNANYFADLEESAMEFRASRPWPPGEPILPEELEAVLKQEFGYTIDYSHLATHLELKGFRSVFASRSRPTLYVNGDLLASQRAFILAREIGYQVLALDQRAMTSSWLEVESFDQVLNNFKASYFAGALLLDRTTVEADAAALFGSETWQPNVLRAGMRRFDATPETYFIRLTQLVPRRFGLAEMFFLRMSTQPDGQVMLTKLYNTSALPLAAGLGLSEHYCRRWASLRLLTDTRGAHEPELAAQRSHFLDSGQDFFVVSAARSLALDARRRSAVTLGWRLDSSFRRQVRFWNDPQVAKTEVNLTCERCGLTSGQCSDRVAEPTAIAEREALEAKRSAARALVAGGDGAPVSRPDR